MELALIIGVVVIDLILVLVVASEAMRPEGSRWPNALRIASLPFYAQAIAVLFVLGGVMAVWSKLFRRN